MDCPTLKARKIGERPQKRAVPGGAALLFWPGLAAIGEGGSGGEGKMWAALAFCGSGNSVTHPGCEEKRGEAPKTNPSRVERLS